MYREYFGTWAIFAIVAVAGLYYFATSAKAPERLDPSTEAAMTIPAELYRSEVEGFAIERPASAEVRTGSFSAFTPVTQTFSVGIALLPALFQNTDLKDAAVYIGATSTESVARACLLEFKGTAETQVGTTTIAGVPFAAFHSTATGGGDTYDLTVYRALRDGTCYEIGRLLHFGESEIFFSTSVEYSRFVEYLEAIIRTFVFLL